MFNILNFRLKSSEINLQFVMICNKNHFFSRMKGEIKYDGLGEMRGIKFKNINFANFIIRNDDNIMANNNMEKGYPDEKQSEKIIFRKNYD